jgi:formylglycine-generating enzyme required for sulfatase activity
MMGAIIRRSGAIRTLDRLLAPALCHARWFLIRVLLAFGCAGAVHGAGPDGIFRDCDVCPEMVKVPAGTFIMGSPATERDRAANEGPQRTVRIDAPFAVGRHEVTRAQFAAFAGAGAGIGSKRRLLRLRCREIQLSLGCRGAGLAAARLPAAGRSSGRVRRWHEAKAYVEWLSKKTGRDYRLLSEAEWEYAARAGATTSRPWGDDPNRSCAHANLADDTLVREVTRGTGARWYAGWHACRDRYAFTAPVGRLGANRFGLHDMIGNAWEWVEDCWNDSYSGAPADARPRLAGDCAQRIYRGGAWRSYPGLGRSAQRSKAETGVRHALIGFRVARTLENPPR